MKDFPLVVEKSVFFCGFNSQKSYGGNSYFIRDVAGNWLIDSPKFVRPLVKQLEVLGGTSHIFLTHRDDLHSPITRPKPLNGSLETVNPEIEWGKRCLSHTESVILGCDT
jgi:hypothetical protein